MIHVRTPLELSEVAAALYDRISTVTPDDVSVFGMSNPQPPAEPTLGEKVSDRIAAAHRLRAPVGAALEEKLQTLVAQQRHESYRDVFRTVD